MVWNRPDQDQLDDTAEFPAITDLDGPPGWHMVAERGPVDGEVVIEIIELTEDELSGPDESPPRHANQDMEDGHEKPGATRGRYAGTHHHPRKIGATPPSERADN